MNNPATRQQWILDELTKISTLSFKNCFSKYSVKFSRTEQTFSKDWKIAKEKHTQHQKMINEAKEQEAISHEIKLLRSRLNDKDTHAKRLLDNADELSKIKLGRGVKSKEIMIVYTASDVIRAKSEIRQILKQIGDWYGFNAPDNLNVNQTVKNQIDWDSLPVEVVEQVINAGQDPIRKLTH